MREMTVDPSKEPSMSLASTNLSRRAVALAASAAAVLTLAVGALDAHADPPPPPPPPPAGSAVAPPSSPPASPVDPGATPAPSTNPSTTAPAPTVTPGPDAAAPSTAPPTGNGQAVGPASSGPVLGTAVHGDVLTLTVRCGTSGSVKLTDAHHGRIASRAFTCAGGRATVALTLPRALARQTHTRRGVTVSATVRERGAAAKSARLRLTSARARGVARASSAATSTYCEFDSGAGLPLCYEYWLDTYGSYWYPQYGRYLWAGKASRWLSGEFQGYVWFWYYWNGSAWIGYGRS
jgi:hypothetical protein